MTLGLVLLLEGVAVVVKVTRSFSPMRKYLPLLKVPSELREGTSETWIVASFSARAVEEDRDSLIYTDRVRSEVSET